MTKHREPGGGGRGDQGRLLFANSVSEGASPILSSVPFATNLGGMATGLSSHLGPNQYILCIEDVTSRKLAHLGGAVPGGAPSSWRNLSPCGRPEGMGLALSKHHMKGVHPGPPQGSPLTSCYLKGALKHQVVSNMIRGRPHVATGFIF